MRATSHLPHVLLHSSMGSSSIPETCLYRLQACYSIIRWFRCFQRTVLSRRNQTQRLSNLWYSLPSGLTCTSIKGTKGN